MFKIIEKISNTKIALLKPNSPRIAWIDGKELFLVLVEERGGNVHVQFFTEDDSKRRTLTFNRGSFSTSIGEVTDNDLFLAALVRVSLLQLEAGVGGKTQPLFTVNQLTAAYLRRALDSIDPAREVIITEEPFGNTIIFEMDGFVFARGQAEISYGVLEFTLMNPDCSKVYETTLGSGGSTNYEIKPVLCRLEKMAPRSFEGGE